MRRLVLWVSCVAQMMVVLDISVINVALPSIRADLGLGRAEASWVAMAYGLGFAGVLLVGARLADVVGTARLLLWGVGMFTVASVVGGLATEGWVLIAARAAQGVCAAALSPATFTLLTTTYEEGPDRTRAIAAWTAVSLAGGGVGTIAGGVLTDLLTWRATLLINLPIGAVVALAAAVLHRRSGDRPRGGRIGLRGAALATGAFTGATYALSVVGEPGQGARSLLVAGVAGVLFAVLVLEQRHTRDRLVPSELLRDRLILGGNAATALVAASFQVALWFFLTFRMQGVLGFTPIQTGLAFLPLTACTLAANLWVTPRLMGRHPPRVLVVAGVALAAPGLLWLAVVDTGHVGLTVLAPSVAIGLGGGLMNTPLATIVTTGVRPEHAGAASGLMNTAKQFGGAVGLAVMSTAAGFAGTDAAAFGLMALTLVLAGVLAAALRPSGRQATISSAQTTQLPS